MESIADRISLRRKELGLTQKQLAEILHVSDKTVSRWETGKQIPDALTMQEIAKALDLSVSELYGVEEEAMGGQENEIEKTAFYKKIKRIFLFGLVFALVLISGGLCLTYVSFYGLKNNVSVSCQTDEFPMYMLTGYDQSIVEWVEYCNTAGEELSHVSAQAGDTAYYLFYLPRGSEETEVDYSYSDGPRGRVLSLNFRNVSEEVDDMHYLCYMKFPCEDSIILKTYIDGKEVESYSAYAMFTGLCENILFKSGPPV